MWAWFAKPSFTAQTVSSNYRSTNLSYAPYIHKWVIHALRVSSFGDDNMLSGNHLSFYRRHKSWHNLFVGFQALVILELIIWAKARVKNQIAKQIGLFDWWQTFWMELFARDSCRVDSNYIFWRYLGFTYTQIFGICSLYTQILGICSLFSQCLGMCSLYAHILVMCSLKTQMFGVCSLFTQDLGICPLYTQKLHLSTYTFLSWLQRFLLSAFLQRRAE